MADLAEHLRDTAQSSAAAVSYGLVMTFGGVVRRQLALVGAGAAPGLARGAPSHSRRRPPVAGRSGAYGLGTVVAVLDASVAFGLFAFAAGFFAVSGRAAAVPADQS